MTEGFQAVCVRLIWVVFPMYTVGETCRFVVVKDIVEKLLIRVYFLKHANLW